jgi:hypothetical protein
MIADIRKLNAKALKARKTSEKNQIKRDELEKKIKKDRIETRKRYLAETIGGVYFEDDRDGIKVVNLEQWEKANCDAKDPEKALFAWCQRHKAYYYAKKDGFSMDEAMAETVAQKRKVLIYKAL